MPKWKEEEEEEEEEWTKIAKKKMTYGAIKKVAGILLFLLA